MLQRRALGLIVRRAVPLGDLIDGEMAEELIENDNWGERSAEMIRFESSQFRSNRRMGAERKLCCVWKAKSNVW